MQKIQLFKTTAALLIAAATLSACSSERSGEPAFVRGHNTRTVVFTATEIQTRTAFGPGQDGVYPTLWTANDAAVKLALNFTEAAEAAVVPSDNFLTASFSAEIDATGKQAPYTFYAVSPASAAKALSPSRKSWNISIPAVQTPLEGSVDEAAQILAAASQPSDEIPGAVDLQFNHLTAYGRMSFKNLDLGDAVVQKVELTSTTPIVGDWYWDCTESHALVDNGASSTLTLNTSRTTDIWFACAPVDVSGEIIIFTVYTDKGVFVKEVEFPLDRKFNSGRIAVFSVDMSGIEISGGGTSGFVLVTDASVLQAGDEIIITDKSGTKALGSQNNGKTPYRNPVDITVSGGVISDPGSAEILTLENGLSSGTWALKASDGYLSTSSTKNSLTTSSSLTVSGSWTISITNSGDATVKASFGSYCYLRYNSGNPRFSGYGENSNVKDPVAIYRKGAASLGPVAYDPIEDSTDYGCYLADGTRTYVSGTDQISRRYSSDGVQTFTVLDPEAKEQLEISGYRKSLVKGDPVSITVNWRKGFSEKITGKTYSVTVVKEEGPKVWLGNGSGHGFIIKK